MFDVLWRFSSSVPVTVSYVVIRTLDTASQNTVGQDTTEAVGTQLSMTQGKDHLSPHDPDIC